MGGTKRKIPMEKRETQPQRAVAFSKRRKGLFKKAAELCVISGARVAILATPPSDKLNTVYSFGHSSVDDVVDAFLGGRRPTLSARTHNCLPTKKSGLGFWWENCDDPDELRSRIEKLQTLKNNVETCLGNRKKKIVPLGHDRDHDCVSGHGSSQYGPEFLEHSTAETEEVKNKGNQENTEINGRSWNDNLGRDMETFLLENTETQIFSLEHDLRLEYVDETLQAETGETKNKKAQETAATNNVGDSDAFSRELNNSLLFPDGSATIPGEEIINALGTWFEENNITIDAEHENDQSHWYDEKHGGLVGSSESIDFLSQIESFLMMD